MQEKKRILALEEFRLGPKPDQEGALTQIVIFIFGSVEAVGPDRFYTPHTYIGALVSALFLGRIAYRFIVLYSTSHAVAAGSLPFSSYERSPLTLALFGVLVGYYVAYYTGVLRRGARLTVPVPTRP